jgi:hypothetical protein
MTLALLAGVMAISTSVAAAPAAKGYLIGARAPLTQAQTQALKDAGAQITSVYKNFGGAAAAIPDSKLSAVRSLSLSPRSTKTWSASSTPSHLRRAPRRFPAGRTGRI